MVRQSLATILSRTTTRHFIFRIIAQRRLPFTKIIYQNEFERYQFHLESNDD